MCFLSNRTWFGYRKNYYWWLVIKLFISLSLLSGQMLYWNEKAEFMRRLCMINRENTAPKIQNIFQLSIMVQLLTLLCLQLSPFCVCGLLKVRVSEHHLFLPSPLEAFTLSLWSAEAEKLVWGIHCAACFMKCTKEKRGYVVWIGLRKYSLQRQCVSL
jgi:hypothetical protein